MDKRIIKDIKGHNRNSVFKIRYKKRKHNYSIFLEINRKDLRKTVSLRNYFTTGNRKGVFITGQASKYKEENKILNKVNEKQLYYNERYELKGSKALAHDKIRESNICDFYEVLKNKRSGNTKKTWSNSFKHFKEFTNSYGKNIFSDINYQFCESYREYLLSQVSANSTCTYYSNFKTVLNNAVKKGVIDTNYASFVANPIPEVKREFLTADEVKQLINSDYVYPEIKNAFLFSCFTGLRISDLKKLTWKNIKDEYLDFFQTKTRTQTRIKLSKSALKILNRQKSLPDQSNLIFMLPGNNAINKHLSRWIEGNGINKHITFHCGRHTFATMCLTYDIDIYTVSKLLGHTDIKHTQIYAKLIDKKRDQAIDRLPEL